MSDIFVSYKREDHPKARKLANALESKGWTVWWDPKLRAGENFDKVIEAALKESKCVIVMWSERAVESDYVLAEATWALNHKKLVPVSVEVVEVPFRFQGIHTPCLIEWDALEESSDFRKLVDDISSILGPSPAVVAAAEEQRRLEAEAQRKAEEERLREQERQRAELEAKRKAEEENRRRIEEEKIRAQEEGERRRLEAEAQRKAEEERLREQERQRAELEAKQKAEEENRRRIEEEKVRAQQAAEQRRLEEEAQRKAEEERLREQERQRAELEAGQTNNQKEVNWRWIGASSIAVISMGILGIMLYRQVGDHQRPAVHTDKAEQIQETRLPPTVGPEAKADVSKARTETETVEAFVSTPESKTAAGSKPQIIEEIERKERQVVPPPITEKGSPRAAKKTEIPKQPEIAKKIEPRVPPPITEKVTPAVKETEIPKQPEVAKKSTEQPNPTESESQIASIKKQTEVPTERRLIGLATSPTRTSINVKDKVSLTVKGKYSDGRDEIVAGVRWQSSNEYIAEVNSKGVLEGKNEGKVEITASYAGVSTVYTVYIRGVEVEKPKDSETPIRDTEHRFLR